MMRPARRLLVVGLGPAPSASLAIDCTIATTVSARGLGHLPRGPLRSELVRLGLRALAQPATPPAGAVLVPSGVEPPP